MKKELPLWALHGLTIVSTILVSGSFTVGKAITHGLDPAVLTLVRFGLAALLFLPIMTAQHGFSLPPLKALAGYAAISACTVGFFWCMFEALRYTSALSTSVIFTLVPGISGLYSALFLKERLGRPRLVALLLGMFGALWVIFRGDLGRLLAMEVNRGDLLFLGGCFLMAAYPPLVKRLYRRESMLVMTFWVLASGVGWLLLLAWGRLGAVDWAGVSVRVWAGIGYLAVFSTMVSFYLTQLATLSLGPTRVLAYSYFYPAFVLLIDWGFGKPFPPAIILPGVAVVTLSTLVVQSGVQVRPLAARGKGRGERRRN